MIRGPNTPAARARRRYFTATNHPGGFAPTHVAGAGIVQVSAGFGRLNLMAYIPYIPDDEAAPELKRLYDKYRDRAGHVDNILRIHGPNPPSLEAHYQFYVTLMRGRSELTRIQKEMIAVTVSSINQCHY